MSRIVSITRDGKMYDVKVSLSSTIFDLTMVAREFVDYCYGCEKKAASKIGDKPCVNCSHEEAEFNCRIVGLHWRQNADG